MCNKSCASGPNTVAWSKGNVSCPPNRNSLVSFANMKHMKRIHCVFQTPVVKVMRRQWAVWVIGDTHAAWFPNVERGHAVCGMKPVPYQGKRSTQNCRQCVISDQKPRKSGSCKRKYFLDMFIANNHNLLLKIESTRLHFEERTVHVHRLALVFARCIVVFADQYDNRA